MARLASAALAAAVLATMIAPTHAILDRSSAIWHPSGNATHYVLLRSPPFTLPQAAGGSGLPSGVSLSFTASQSPNIAGSGTTQSKLLGAMKVWVNGVLYTAGPGHNVPASQQAVVQPSAYDGLAQLFRPYPAANVIAIESYFSNTQKGKVDATARAGVQLELALAFGATTLNVSTGPTWSAYAADAYYSPDGDNNDTPWYVCPNEDLDANVRQTGWEDPGFVPGAGWVPAQVQPSPYNGRPLYAEPAPAPAMLWRSPCGISTLPAATSTCGTAAEQSTLTLTCAAPSGPGGVVTSVLFASYGTPNGTCLTGGGGNTFAVNASCNSPNSTAVVSALCLGKASCDIPVSNGEFGGPDPCHLTPKHLSVAVNCSGGGGGGSSSYHYVVDFGQEFMGGVNLTIPGVVPSGASVLVRLGEELLATGSVMVPTRAAENYTSLWHLKATQDPSGDPANFGLHQHEFIEFRYAEILSTVPIANESVRAWVVQHPFSGTGLNPFEKACSTSTPNAPLPPSPPPHASDFGVFSSSNPGLDAVFNFTAYTAVATTLDINVDSQTRQRDLCHIDALITGLEQYAVFPPLDYGIQRRTFLDAFGNDSAIWGSWTEFKMSGALMAYSHALETGDLSVAQATWSDDDMSIAVSADYNSLQFYGGVRYFNKSGNGLLHFPADCGGSWACDPLVDWPTSTRDGYVITGNDDDAVRNGLGVTAIRGMAAVAGWLGKTAAQTRYTAYADSVSAAILATMYHGNGTTEAYFTDGAGQSHAALHSTLYAVAGGVLDAAGPTRAAQIAPLLAAYLRRRDVAPSSCMTGRWYVQALYQLGVYAPDAADFGLELLSRTTYPSWGNMIAEWGATTTLEAWAPPDKWNTDWAHPWCASPAFLIPRLLLGVQPTDLGWRSMLAAPQPGNLTFATGTVPTPLGSLVASFSQDGTAQTVTLALSVPTGSSSRVCLPPLHPDVAAGRAAGRGSGDSLTVDGAQVGSAAWGRLLCTTTNVGPGSHTIVRS